MKRTDAEKLAAAIALANGHSHPEEWAAKVGAAFDEFSGKTAPAEATEDPSDEAGSGEELTEDTGKDAKSARRGAK